MVCKGADSAIFPRLKFTHDKENQIKILQQVVMNYANAGLRTMVFAQLRFTVADYKRFQVIQKLLRTMSNDELVDVFDKFEQGLEFVGITAVND